MSEEKSLPEKAEEKIEQVMTGDYTTHWKKYYEGIAGERMKEVTKLAKQDQYKIRLITKDGEEWKEETYKYREIPTKKWLELEELRSEYADLEKIAASKVLDVKDTSYNYTKQLNTLLAKIYKLSAQYFLKMTDEEWDRALWVDIKGVIDACNHRTIFTLPN